MPGSLPGCYANFARITCGTCPDVMRSLPGCCAISCPDHMRRLTTQSYIDTGTLITLAMETFKNKSPIGKLTENDKQRFLKFLNN